MTKHTQQYYYDACEGKISKKSIVQYSGDWVIMGKYGMIENLGSKTSPEWDIWVTGVHHAKVLSTKRVKSVLSSLKPYVKCVDTHFNNEATALCTSENSIALVARVLGARKKRELSAESLAKLQAGKKKSRQSKS